MNSRSSANSTMSSYTASVLRWERPRNAAFRYTFSLPVSSGWNPAPSSSRPPRRPRSRETTGRPEEDPPRRVEQEQQDHDHDAESDPQLLRREGGEGLVRVG